MEHLCSLYFNLRVKLALYIPLELSSLFYVGITSIKIDLSGLGQAV